MTKTEAQRNSIQEERAYTLEREASTEAAARDTK